MEKKINPKFRSLFIFLASILLLIIVFSPLVKHNNQEGVTVYTYKEFLETYTNLTYEKDEDVLEIIQKEYSMSSKKSNSVIEVFENKKCSNNCNLKKIIINKNKKNIIVKEKKMKNEKAN